jgi:hypothetical protein
MVRTRASEDAALDMPEGSAGRERGCGQAPRDNPPPPPPHAPVNIEELLATQNELMRLLVQSEAHRGVDRPQHNWQQDMNTSYFDFLATHLLIFSRAKDSLDAYNWLRTTELSLAFYTTQSTRRLCMSHTN